MNSMKGEYDNFMTETNTKLTQANENQGRFKNLIETQIGDLDKAIADAQNNNTLL